jgi:hypothetical protein
MCCTKYSSVVNSIYSGQELFSYNLFNKNVPSSLASFKLFNERWRIKRIVSKVNSGNTNLEERLSTVDLLIMVACFVKKENDIFNLKISWCNLVSTRRSTVLSLSPSVRLPWLIIPSFLYFCRFRCTLYRPQTSNLRRLFTLPKTSFTCPISEADFALC